MLDVKSEAKKIEDEIINLRRQFHMIPELHTELPLTTHIIKQYLNKLGLEYRTYSNGGITAVIEGNNDGPTIAFRSDMDALPVKEETGLDFSSKHEGKMHACGHDAHIAMLLGAAKILAENKNEIDGKVVLIFQPAEETTGGAEKMINEGCLSSPKVDRFISMHVGNLFPKVTTGKFGVRKGSMMAAVASFNVTVKGVGGHGARPHECIDPILISCEIIQSIQKIVSREIDPIHGAVITVGMINGGSIVNVIPEEVSFGGTVRTLTLEDSDYIEKRLKKLIVSIAEGNGAEAEVDYIKYYPPTINDSEVTDFLENCAQKIVGKENIVIIDEPETGTEDVAYYINNVPGSFGILGSSKAHSDGNIYPHHNSKFCLDESVFWIGTAVFVQCAMDFCRRRIL